jgi:hypothetical protein
MFSALAGEKMYLPSIVSVGKGKVGQSDAGSLPPNPPPHRFDACEATGKLGTPRLPQFSHLGAAVRLGPGNPRIPAKPDVQHGWAFSPDHG